MQQLSTIGYEGATIEDFVATLGVSGVTTLLDVRELPISRRRGFAKNALRDALEAAGIHYRHEKRLGSPKPIRDQLKQGGWDYSRFFKRYEAHLAEQHDLLTALVEQLEGHVALMCYERDPRQCHRSVIADVLAAQTGVATRHIGVHTSEQRNAYEGADSYPRKGVSTT